jgi:hypothetical protein
VAVPRTRIWVLQVRILRPESLPNLAKKIAEDVT